ncbi:unnamed protein product [Agarophyton chilense]|eukprot:gb/GEZJ01002916.1/.p1 GENE.gb/GEZJ01002916.1/~~gb/GEZJ01002916.1/.p1  ORF type:complete len:454 (-),score=71.60 gb/GEZJ01002916.1/:1509-2870(-)
MILRIRLPNGATERVNLDSGETLQHLGAKIEALDKMEGQFALYSDIRFTQPFMFEQARHGDVIFIKGVAKPTAPSKPQTSPSPSSSAPEPKVSAADETTTDRADDDQPQPEPETWRPRCRHGPRGMCEHCMPKEDKRKRYENELAKWKGRGMSVAVMEALEALKTKITAQSEAHVTAVLVDNKAAEQFQAYIARTGFQQQRIGICYGDVTESGETRVLAIYEPPQSGSDQFYKLDDEGDMTQRADTVAQLLGLQRVGIVFSARPRKCILSGMDVIFAARMAKDLSDEQKKAFVVLVVTTAETGETLFEAYQISDLAMQMYVDDIFEDQDNQKPNSGRVVCKEDVLVEGKDARKVHTEFFLLNIPIKSCDSWLRTAFAVENREIAPQGPSDLKKILANEELSYTQRLSDFHALLFLSNIFDMSTDMPGLLSSIKEGQDIGEGFRLMIDGMASPA